MSQEKVDSAKEQHRKTELKLNRAASYADISHIAESEAIRAHYDRQILIEWIDRLEEERKKLIDKYEAKIQRLEECLPR